MLQKRRALYIWLHTVWLYSGMITCLSSRCVFFVLFITIIWCVCVCMCVFGFSVFSASGALLGVDNSMQYIKAMMNQGKEWKTLVSNLRNVELHTVYQLLHRCMRYQYSASVFNMDYRINAQQKTKARVVRSLCTWLAHQYVQQVRCPLDIRLWSHQ